MTAETVYNNRLAACRELGMSFGDAHDSATKAMGEHTAREAAYNSRLDACRELGMSFADAHDSATKAMNATR